MSNSLQTEFLGTLLPSPLVLPAGVLGMSAGSLQFALSKGYGLVTTKSLSLEPRSGHEGPVVAEYGAGILNSMGLCNPGIAEGLKEVNQFVERSKAPILVSLFATNREDFVELVRRTNDSAATYIELNLSCPNVMDEYGIPLASSKEMVSQIVEGVKAVSRVPVLAKLSPNAADVPSIAAAAEQAGADGLTLINTLGPGLLIDPYARKPILHPTYGGVSGPAIKPIALKIVYDCSRRVRIPIIGMGGISSGLDAVEMLMAGARLVGVGSAIWKEGIGVVGDINIGIKQFLKTEGFSSVAEIPRLSQHLQPVGLCEIPSQKPSDSTVLSYSPALKVKPVPPDPVSVLPGEASTLSDKPYVNTFQSVSGRFSLPLQRVREEGAKAKTFYVRIPYGYFPSEPKPGQFFMLTDYQGGEKPISVSEWETTSEGYILGITIKVAGPFTQRFQSKAEGSLISLRGPYGKPFSLHRGKVLLVGGGCGIAPLHFLAKTLVSRGAEITVINGARKEEELLFSDRFNSFPIRYLITVEDKGEGTAVDTAKIILSEEKFDFIYAAGPELMMAALKPLLKDMEYEFLMERYMKCGVGICGSCTCDPTGIRLCVEGPVLDKREVENLSDFGKYKRDASGKRVVLRPGISSCLRDTL
ncbi:MAG: dihydroorotate dehydrogenase [Spirochaetales bacterium]